MSYAFVSHASALEALRTFEAIDNLPTWPSDVRLLPFHGDCIRNQKMFRDFASEVDIKSFGIISRPVDLLVPHENMRSRGQAARFHVWKGPVPLGQMLRVHERLLVSKPAFVMVQMAGYHPKYAPIAEETGRKIRSEIETLARLGIDQDPIYERDPFRWAMVPRFIELVLCACEMMGTYRLGTGGKETQYEKRPLMRRADVEELFATMPSLYGRHRVLRALDISFASSASPRETALALMLTLPTEIGGFGLPRPELNVSIDVHGLEVTHSWQEEVVPDLLWREAGLVLEYDSDEFHGKAGGAKLASDAFRANVLVTQGYRVLRATTHTVDSLAELELLAHQVAATLGVPLYELSAEQRLRREQLHALLLR